MDTNYHSVKIQSVHTNNTLVYDFIPIFIILLSSLLLTVQLRVQVFPNLLLGSDKISDLISITFNQPVAGTGWHPPEETISWMSDTRATLHAQLTGQEYDLFFRARGITPEILDSLQLSLDGKAIALNQGLADENYQLFSATIPAGTIDDLIITRDSELVFTVSEVVSPAALGLNVDNRLLGVSFADLQIVPVERGISQSPLFVVIAAVAAGLITAVKAVLEQNIRVRKRHRLILVYGGILFTLILTRLLLPDLASIQLVYFVLAGVIISYMVIRAPTISRRNVFYHLEKLWENRVLLRIWARYNIQSRYSQTFLGILWIIIQPFSTALILSFVFSQVLKAVDTSGAPFISFYLTATIPWVLFSSGLMNGMNSVMGAMGLVTQVYFPREILILVKITETLVDVSFTFVAMLLINLLVGILPNINFIYLPLLILIQTMLMLGISFYASYLAVMIRDIPQLVTIILQFLFYLTPILYPLSALPEEFAFVGIINPLSPLVGAYRDIILYNRPPDPVSLYYTLTVAGVLFYTGYMNFKRNEKQLADYA